MDRMADMQELIEKPLSSEELAVRYRALCDDPCFANVPGKIELDVWGRVLMSPPKGCIEVAAPSNSVKELNEKRHAYLEVGAVELWIVYPQSKRCEFYGPQGALQRSAYEIDLSDIFRP